MICMKIEFLYSNKVYQSIMTEPTSFPLTNIEEIRHALAAFRCTEPVEQYEVMKHNATGLAKFRVGVVPDPAHAQNLLLTLKEPNANGDWRDRLTLDSDSICKQLHKLALYTTLPEVVIDPKSHAHK
jgi:hypothetical protein